MKTLPWKQDQAAVVAYSDTWFEFSPEDVKLKPTGREVGMDQLYKEFCSRWEEIQRDRQDTTKSTSEKWMTQPTGCTVPGSVAFVERLFSLMTIKQSDS